MVPFNSPFLCDNRGLTEEEDFGTSFSCIIDISDLACCGIFTSFLLDTSSFAESEMALAVAVADVTPVTLLSPSVDFAKTNLARSPVVICCGVGFSLSRITTVVGLVVDELSDVRED